MECVRCKSKNVAKSLGRVAYYCRDCGFRWAADGDWTSDGKAINVDNKLKTHKMTTIQVVKIKREEDSEWEKALELNINAFDAIQRVYDENGLEVDEYYDIDHSSNNKLIPICRFP